MTHEYDRSCSWCKPSTYIKLTTIKEVLPAPKSDKLDVVTFTDVGYTTVVERGLHSVGEVVYFVPGETLIPNELADKMKIRSYLSHSRVKTIRLRGNRSEGLVVPPAILEPYLDGLLKWEDQEQLVQGPGKRKAGKRFWEFLKPDMKPKEFSKFYEMPNLLNEPYTFKPGDRVAVSEKIHGMNARFSLLPRKWKWWAKPFAKLFGAKQYVTYIGSHNVVLNPNENRAWQVAYRTFLEDRLPGGYIFYGEIFGKFQGRSIQHLTYGRSDLDLKLFAAYDIKNQEYLIPAAFCVMCDEYNLPRVKFRIENFESVEGCRKWADEPSEYSTKHHREGVVLCHTAIPGRFAKVISFKYLEDNKRTEGKQ